ncbi:hypothetical protein BGZ58_000204, partial [Dissophora ornata]
MSANTNPTDLAPQDDASFASLVQDITLSSNDPSSIESQIPLQIQKLEAAKAKLQQDENSQETWDEVSNTFQFFADAAREEKTRTPIGESSAVALILSIETLNKQRRPHVDIQAMRAFANICVDH